MVFVSRKDPALTGIPGGTGVWRPSWAVQEAVSFVLDFAYISETFSS